MGRTNKPPLHIDTPSIPITIPGIGTLEAGTLFSVKGSKGRYRYSTTNETATVVECFGGISGHNQFRAFRPDQVRKIEVKP